MRIELHKHAVDGIGDKLFVLRLFDIFLADMLENFSEKLEISVDLRVRRNCLVVRRGLKFENSASAGSD